MVRFGVAGYPPAFYNSIYSKDRIDILKWIRDLKLDAFELQMTYGPKTLKETCIKYRNLADELGIKLSIHAAYYIVLTSSDPKKIERSIDTLKRTFELADILGVEVVVLHPGSLYGENADNVMRRLVENLNEFFESIGKTTIGLYLETAGKVGQFGSVDEILSASRQIEGCHPCIDFGHVNARSLGKLSDHGEIRKVFDKLGEYLISAKSKKVHFHYTPINYGPRGEIGHKALEDVYPENDQLRLNYDPKKDKNGAKYYQPRFEPIIEKIRENKLDCTVISETFNSQERGAIAMKECYLRAIS